VKKKKLYYEVEFGIYHTERKTIRASSDKEAKVLAIGLTDKLKKLILRNKIKPTVVLSDRNFRLDVGAIYLLRRYSKYVPAECVSSSPRHRYYMKEDFCHTFRYLDSDKYCSIYSVGFKKHKRLVRQLCKDGEITEKCNHCVARFNCFTNKGGATG
jgi:hypothetical protein